MLRIAAALALAAVALAKPNGSPACVVSTAVMEKMGGQNANLGFTFQAPQQFQPGVPVTIAMNNPTIKTFKGLLIYAQSSSDPKHRCGSFNVPAGFKALTNECQQAGITGAPDSVVSHASPDDKPTNMQIQWTPDADPKCAQVTIMAAVVDKGAQDWQVAPDLTLSAIGGGGGGLPIGNGANVRRCRRMPVFDPTSGQYFFQMGQPLTGQNGLVEQPAQPVPAPGNAPVPAQPGGQIDPSLLPDGAGAPAENLTPDVAPPAGGAPPAAGGDQDIGLPLEGF